jgi:hypothetical protein
MKTVFSFISLDDYCYVMPLAHPGYRSFAFLPGWAPAGKRTCNMSGITIHMKRKGETKDGRSREGTDSCQIKTAESKKRISNPSQNG